MRLKEGDDIADENGGIRVQDYRNGTPAWLLALEITSRFEGLKRLYKGIGTIRQQPGKPDQWVGFNDGMHYDAWGRYCSLISLNLQDYWTQEFFSSNVTPVSGSGCSIICHIFLVLPAMPRRWWTAPSTKMTCWNTVKEAWTPMTILVDRYFHF